MDAEYDADGEFFDLIDFCLILYFNIIFNSIKIGIRTGFQLWKAVFIVYVIQFLLALTIGLQVYQVVEASIGNSLELNKLLTGYSETVVKDFLNVHGASLSPLIGQLRYELLVYIVFAVFLNAGILSGIVKNESSWKSFWKGGAEYFARFLGNAFFFVLIALIWAAIIWVPFIVFFPNSAEYVSSEKISMIILFALAALYLFGMFFFFNWSVISRLNIIEENQGSWTAIQKSHRVAWRHYFPFTQLFLFFLFIELMIVAVYWWVEGLSGMISSTLVVVFFFVQQLFILMRVFMRVMMYGGLRALRSIRMKELG